MPKFLTAEEYLFRKARKATADRLAKRVSFKTADEVLAERNGKDGADGRDGRDGKDGMVGPQGPAGTPGRDGIGFNWRGDWRESETYQKNDVVNYLGTTYIATAPSSKDYPNKVNNNWDLMAAAGASGARGPQGEQGPSTGVPTFIQDETPDYDGPYVWVQTGLGADGSDYTVWYQLC